MGIILIANIRRQDPASTSAPPSAPPDATTAATQWVYGSNWVRHGIVRDANFDVRSYRPQDFRERVQRTSALMRDPAAEQRGQDQVLPLKGFERV